MGGRALGQEIGLKAFWRMSSGNHALCLKLGRRIKLLRMRKELTQVELAVHLGINRGHLSDIELGKREVGIITLQIIARGLGTTMASLLNDGRSICFRVSGIPDIQAATNGDP